MPAAAPDPGTHAAATLVALGARLRARRKSLGLAATTTAEAAGLSRVTLHRIEAGNASVTVGAVVAVAAALGLDLVVNDPQEQTAAQASLPSTVSLAAHPQLKALAWQMAETTELTPQEALALYERNWRHVDVAALDDDERAFIRRLVAAFGGRLLV